MNFLNPTVLIGLIAAGIPLLLHLLNLRKQKTIDFSTLKFIKELQKSRIRKLKIKQWILLLLRTLIIIFAVMAFARPTINQPVPYFESYSKSSAVIIVDNSFSMDVSDEFGNRLNQAKKAASKIVQSLREGDEISVITSAEYNDGDYSFYRNLDYINDKINSIKISNNKSNLYDKIKIAAKLLDDAININKEIFIISDGQKNVFPETIDSLKINENISVNFIQIGGSSVADIKNTAIDSLNIRNQIFQFGRQIRIDAIISGASKNTIEDVVVSLEFNNERIAQRTVNIPAKDKTAISIEANINQRGPIDAKLVLENDELLQDNYEYFSFLIPQKPRIAYLSNDYQNRFLKLAINAGNGNDIISEELSSNNTGGKNLNDYDILILSKGPYKSSELSRIKSYLASGGRIMLFAHNNQDDNYNSFLNEIGFGSIQKSEYTENPIKIDFADIEHPIFDNLFISDDKEKSIESPEIRKTISNSGGRIIIRANQSAILSESDYEDGKALYFSIAPDMSMSDFPVNSIFPALINRALMYLTANNIKGNDFITGESPSIKISNKDAGNGNFKITDPNGNEFFRQAAMLPTGAIISFENLNIPGNYFISQNEKVISMFSVNNIPSESDLELRNNSELSDYFENNFSADINIIDDMDKTEKIIQHARIGTELWQIFVILAILCAFAEMIIQKNTKKEQIAE